jgi:TolB-like protein
MKPRILTVLTILMLAAGVSAAGKNPPLTVAVYDFTDTDKDTTGYGSKVTALITADLTTETGLVMVERSDLKKALGEQALGVSGMVNSEEAAKIGQVTGVKVLISGQVIQTEKNRLVIVADIVGTETGRLFAEKVEGATEKFTSLTADLSRKIARNIREHAASFVNETQSHEAYLEHIVSSVKGTNRPSVSVDFHLPRGSTPPIPTANSEMAIILQKAGFAVVDANAERKPDIEISGFSDSDVGPKRSDLYSVRTVVEAKVRERQTGKIIVVDRQIVDAVDIGVMTAQRSSEVRAVDAMAEKILPLLAQ